MYFDINSIDIPNQPYILFLGSSHTYGSCQIGDNKIMNYENTYPSIVGETLGYPIVNLGIPGTDNYQILHVLQDWITYGYMDKCVFVSAEIRNQLEGRLSMDMLEPSIDNKKVFSPIFRGKDYEKNKPNSNIRIETWLEMVHRQYSSKKMLSENGKKYLRDMIDTSTQSFGSDPISNLELDNIYEYIKNKIIMERQSSKTTYDLLLLARAMVMSTNVPLRWWTMRGKWHKQTWLYICKTIPDVVENNLFYDTKFPEYQWEMEKEAKLGSEYHCECEHFNTEGHALMANTIIDRIGKILDAR